MPRFFFCPVLSSSDTRPSRPSVRRTASANRSKTSPTDGRRKRLRPTRAKIGTVFRHDRVYPRNEQCRFPRSVRPVRLAAPPPPNRVILSTSTVHAHSHSAGFQFYSHTNVWARLGLGKSPFVFIPMICAVVSPRTWADDTGFAPVWLSFARHISRVRFVLRRRRFESQTSA